MVTLKHGENAFACWYCQSYVNVPTFEDSAQSNDVPTASRSLVQGTKELKSLLPLNA